LAGGKDQDGETRRNEKTRRGSQLFHDLGVAG